MASKQAYVCGFLMDWSMNQWIGLDKGDVLSQGGTPLKVGGVGGKLKKIWQRGDTIKTVEAGERIEYDPSLQSTPPTIRKETPAEAMAREFREETGLITQARVWHCIMIKEYQDAKIYIMVSFVSPSTLRDVVRSTANIGCPEGKTAVYDLIDIFFDIDQFTFDVPVILQMVKKEMLKGFFHKLDPEGVNSANQA